MLPPWHVLVELPVVCRLQRRGVGVIEARSFRKGEWQVTVVGAAGGGGWGRGEEEEEEEE